MPALEESINISSRHAVFINRFAGGLHNEFLPFLEDMRKQLAAQLRNNPPTTEWSRNRLRSQLSDVKSLMAAIFDDYNKGLFDDLKEFSAHEAAFEAQALEKVIESKAIEVTLATDIQAFAAVTSRPLIMGDTAILLNPFIKDWEASQIKRVQNVVRSGFFQGKTIEEMVRAISGKNGVLDKKTRASNRAVIRTATNHVSSVARQTTIEENDDITTGYEWVSTLDSRTSSQCFTGETKVSPLCDIEKLYRSNYTGEIITLNLSTGEKIEGTPNHPVLTQEGWTELGKVDPSYHVIYTVPFDALEISSGKDVYTPSTFAELYDSVGEISSFGVSSKCASAADFNGDGMGMNGEIDILSSECHLRSDVKTRISKKVKNVLLGLVKDTFSFIGYCSPFELLVTGRPTVKTSKFATCSVKGCKEAALRYSDSPFYLGWSNSCVKHLNALAPFGHKIIINKAPRPALHESELLKKASNCGGSGFVMPTDTCGRLPVFVSVSNIIGKSSELKTCHVYTLSTSQGYYTAGGMIVKNCKSLDGTEFLRKNKSKEFQPKPPIHINCRSTIAPILDKRFGLDDSDATRASKGVEGGQQVSADKTYYTWLKTQPKSFIREALGKSRSELFLNGGLTSDEFSKLSVDKLFKPMTLKEMRAKDPMSFESAGI